jgi:hypothetical protein
MVMEALAFTGEELNDREKGILNLADDVLACFDQGEEHFDEAWLDSQFLFRFDPRWTDQVEQVHKMMRAMLHKPVEGELAEEDRIRWYSHILHNFGFAPDERAKREPNPYYSLEPLGMHFREDSNWRERCQTEADESLRVRDRLQGMAEVFNLLPNLRVAREWSPEDLERQFERVASWVIFDSGSPAPPRKVTRLQGGVRVTDTNILFPWQVTRLEERKMDRGIARWIRPRCWDLLRDGPVPGTWKGPRMTPFVRVRTWAIYYLSRRGGGRRAVHTTWGIGAVPLWNLLYPDEDPDRGLHYTKFQSDRRRLFRKGTLKSR